MAMRPCLRSTARRRSKPSGCVVERPRGSQKPAGAWTPMRVSSTDALARAVVAGAAAGAWKAAAEPARRARTTFCCDGDGRVARGASLVSDSFWARARRVSHLWLVSRL